MDRKRRIVIVGAAIVGTATLATSAVVVSNLNRPDDDRLHIVASSTSAGDANALLVPTEGEGTVWTSDGETKGAWLDMVWPEPTTVDRVHIEGADDPSLTFDTATMAFGDGSFLHLTADDQGDIDLEFPERTISTARLTFAKVPSESDAVGLASWTFDDGDGDGASGASIGDVTVATSSDADGSAGDDLIDGDAASGETGAEWAADPSEDESWVSLDWGAPREVASAQIFGPSGTWTDPGYTAAAPLHGRLVFGDGSVVGVSGIAGGGGEPTTVSFMPRMASSVRLELDKTIPAAEIGLREVAIYESGVTPPRWPASSDSTYAVEPPPAEQCEPDSEPFGDIDSDRIALVCPTPGATVGDEAVIVAAAPAGTSIVAEAFEPVGGEDGQGAIARVATATADDSGRATLTFDTASLAHGPLNVRLSATTGDFSNGLGAPLYVQLYNEGGQSVKPPDSPSEGMTLQWEEEFRDPLSVSKLGHDATYAATKPEYWGPSEFGAAVFADPALGEKALATLAEEYLRIRVSPLEGREDPNGFDREHVSGILSSMDVGASGFGAQYGYFEARMLGAPGRGTWPAFWMMNMNSATKVSETTAEVDAVELYGHDTMGSCHGIHNWAGGEDRGGEIRCLQPNGFDDWGMAWHTYGVRVLPGKAIFYIDGSEIGTFTDLSHSSEPFYFLVNLALDGGWPVDLSPSGETVDLYVDYVRVYT
ncbi:family 16 glycosylhydrolase [Lysobacter korlensis]|uniref:Family 16 glycosylhydrolase n=1 Tax=Lysobacter korlensis TaxID=553636 RepID=A0ABV6RWP8_9GAMM